MKTKNLYFLTFLKNLLTATTALGGGATADTNTLPEEEVAGQQASTPFSAHFVIQTQRFYQKNTCYIV